MIRSLTDTTSYAPPPLPPSEPPPVPSEAFYIERHPLAPQVKPYHMLLAFCGLAAVDASGHGLQAYLAGTEANDWAHHGTNWLIQGLLWTLISLLRKPVSAPTYFYFQGGELVRHGNGITKRFGLNGLEKITVYETNNEAETALKLQFQREGRLILARLEDMPRFLSMLLGHAPHGVPVERKRRYNVVNRSTQMLLFYCLSLLLVFSLNFATFGYWYVGISLLALMVAAIFLLQHPRFRARE